MMEKTKKLPLILASIVVSFFLVYNAWIILKGQNSHTQEVTTTLATSNTGAEAIADSRSYDSDQPETTTDDVELVNEEVTDNTKASYTLSVPPEYQNVQAFTDDVLMLEYHKFLEDFDKNLSLNEEQIQAFFKRMAVSLNESESAQQQMQETYSQSEGYQRDLLDEMLVLSRAGKDIIVADAERINRARQEELYPSMFQTYQELKPGVNPEILDRAMEFAVSDHRGEEASFAALNYIGKLEQAKDYPLVHKEAAMETLRQVANASDNDAVKALAVQKLYRLTPPQESTQIAIQNFVSHPSSSLLIETIYSIDSGEVTMNERLRELLRRTLEQDDVARAVSKKELALANNLIHHKPETTAHN